MNAPSPSHSAELARGVESPGEVSTKRPGRRPAVLLIHHGGELYGSDWVFSQVVEALSSVARTVVVLGGTGPLVGRIEDRTHKLLIRPLGVLRRGNLSILGVLKTFFAVTRATLMVRRLIRKHDIELVYSNTLAVVPGALAARLTGTPHVWHVHEMIESPRFLRHALERLMDWSSDRIFVVSNAVRQHWLSGNFKNPQRVRTIYNGMPTTSFDKALHRGEIRREFGVEPDCFLIGVIGRVHYMKGHGTLIEALHLLEKAGWDRFKALIVGDVFRGYEDLLASLENLVEKRGLQGKVEFCGYRTDVASVLQDVDAVVMPSEGFDSLPTVILEAMAARKPVIATASGGAVELVDDGVTGYVVPPGDSGSITEALQALAESREVAVEMGLAGRRKLEQEFSQKRFFERVRAEVASVLAPGLEEASMAVSE